MNEFQQRIGVGSVNYALTRTGPTRKRVKVVEEGPNRGQVGGYETDHKDGRQDAHVFAPTVTKTVSTVTE